MRERLPMGELEASVMDVLWTRGGWSTPGEVHDVLGARRPLAYTSREEHAALRMGEMLTGVADRPAALSAFLRSLPADDRAQLRRLLKGKDAES